MLRTTNALLREPTKSDSIRQLDLKFPAVEIYVTPNRDLLTARVEFPAICRRSRVPIAYRRTGGGGRTEGRRGEDCRPGDYGPFSVTATRTARK